MTQYRQAHRNRGFRPLAAVFSVALMGAVLALTSAPAFATSKPMTPDSEVERFLLELKVRTVLLEKIGLDASDVGVKATMGDISLTGTVKSQALSATVEDVTKEVEGVKGVHNGIKVIDPTQAHESGAGKVADRAGQGLDDGLLEIRIKTRLVSEMGRSGFKVEVEAHDGLVNLSGTVPDQARHDLAMQLAGKTTGVKKVIDLLKVAS
ncbi:MAG: BON domain-containing protein [Acidobacteriota bacterium]